MRLPMTDLASHYLEEIKRQFRGHKRMGEAAMAQLEDMDFFVTLDPESNSVATLVKHIAGNARSRFTDFLTSDGEKPDRFRDQEFEVSAKTTRDFKFLIAKTVRHLKSRVVFRARLAPARRCATHHHHPPGAAHRHAGPQPRARPLCATHWTNRLPRQTPARFTMAHANHSSR